jgi:hypothetical protein
LPNPTSLPSPPPPPPPPPSPPPPPHHRRLRQWTWVQRWRRDIGIKHGVHGG